MPALLSFSTHSPETLAAEAPRKAHFHVCPRYTCGSPSMVDERTALHCARDEKQFYDIHLSGVYGEKYVEQANTKGVSWIVYARWQTGKKVFRLDLLTGEQIVEPPPLLWSDDRNRLLELRNRQKHVGLSSELERELECLEYRALIHREVI